MPHHRIKCSCVLHEDAQADPDTHPEGGPVILCRNPTTSFLTATTLIGPSALGLPRNCFFGARSPSGLGLLRLFCFFGLLGVPPARFCFFWFARRSPSARNKRSHNNRSTHTPNTHTHTHARTSINAYHTHNTKHTHTHTHTHENTHMHTEHAHSRTHTQQPTRGSHAHAHTHAHTCTRALLC